MIRFRKKHNPDSGKKYNLIKLKNFMIMYTMLFKKLSNSYFKPHKRKLTILSSLDPDPDLPCINTDPQHWKG